MDIQERISHIRELEKLYLDHKYISYYENSLVSIKTFGDWHSAAAVLFCEYISSDDKFLKTFVEANTSGNAYVLAGVYDTIHTSYEILMSKVEKGQSTSSQVCCSVEDYDDSPSVFISHASKDRDIIKLFIDNI